MKTLSLVRHAKSSWNDPDLADHERPLAERGRRDLALMCRQVADRHRPADLMLSSTARRALRTAEGLASALSCSVSDIVIDGRLYEASLATLLGVLRGLPADYHGVMLVGHNPGLTELAHHLSASITRLPTCAVLCLELDMSSWGELGPARVARATLDTPRSLKAALRHQPGG